MMGLVWEVIIGAIVLMVILNACENIENMNARRQGFKDSGDRELARQRRVREERDRIKQEEIDRERQREKRVIRCSHPGESLSTEEAVKRVITDHYSDPRRVIKVPVDEIARHMNEQEKTGKPKNG